jgi:hypothetical protein
MEIFHTIAEIVGGNYQPHLGLTGANIKLHYVANNNIVAGITVTEQGNGTYKLEGIPDDKSIYILMRVDGVEQTAFGRRWEGGNPSLVYMEGLTGNIQTQLNARLLLAGGQMSGDVDMNEHYLYNPKDPHTDADVGDRGYNDARYMNNAAGYWNGGNLILKNIADPTDNTGVGDRGYNDTRYLQRNVFQETVNGIGFVGTAPSTYTYDGENIVPIPFATLNQHNCITKGHLLSELNGLEGEPANYSVVRLIPDIAASPGRWYANYAECLALMSSFVGLSPDYEGTIDIYAAGTDTIHVSLDMGATGLDAFIDRVHVTAKNKRICLDVAATGTYAVTQDKVLIQNCTIYSAGAIGKTCTMNGFIFDNVDFILNITSHSFKLINCHINGNCRFFNDSKLTLDNCTGEVAKCTKEPFAIIGTNLIDKKVISTL